jgi:hypothetical protein
MTKTYTISSANEFYGDATQDEADEYADLICAAAAEQFPDVLFEIVSTNNTNNRDADPEGEIQQWINENWTTICS